MPGTAGGREVVESPRRPKRKDRGDRDQHYARRVKQEHRARTSFRRSQYGCGLGLAGLWPNDFPARLSLDNLRDSRSRQFRKFVDRVTGAGVDQIEQANFESEIFAFEPDGELSPKQSRDNTQGGCSAAEKLLLYLWAHFW